MERFNLKKLNMAEGKEQYHAESKTGLQLWKTYAEMNINRAWETIRVNIKILAKDSKSYHELKKHKTWFDEGCSESLDQTKQAKVQYCSGYRIQVK
jgi:hypothetical protein